MTKFSEFVYNLSSNILRYIGVIFTLLLFISALLFSFADTDITTLPAKIRTDNLFVGIICLVLMLLIFYLLKFPCQKNSKLTLRILLAVTMLLYTGCGIFLILCAKSAPISDSYFVYEITQACATNDYTAINPTSYLSVYPHQIGLVFFYEPLLRLWNLLQIPVEGFVFLQYVNIILVLVTLYFMYKIIQLIFQNDYTTACYFVLTWFFTPFYLFILRVYGDISSISLFTVGLWAFIKLTSNKGYKMLLYCLLSIVCFGLSVATRKNVLVAIIGLIIIALLTALFQKKWALLFPIVCYIIISCCTLPAIQAFYEHRAGDELAEGTPPIAFICMGMQQGFHANGWYNSYNYNIYVESGHNMDFIRLYSKKRIDERLDYFKNHPKEAFEFYFEKFASQWCDGTYYSREITACPSAQRDTAFEKFYSKDGGSLYLFVCNIFQTLLYFGAAAFCIYSLFKKEDKTLLPHLGVLIAFGGFLFHLLWEANSRASLPYVFLLLPSAAAGISFCMNKIHKFTQI